MLFTRFANTRNRPTKGDQGVIEVKRQGLRWRLHTDRYLDREIFRKGRFEKRTTLLIRKIVRPGMCAIDVGANFGYFTTILASNVGASGRVLAFEPTHHYRTRIAWHLQANALADRVRVFDFGLSDRCVEMEISIGDCSATLHPVSESEARAKETISLRPLDSLDEVGTLERVDFVKVDIDGHEPSFLDGAKETLRRHLPIMVIEFCQANLNVAGSSVQALRDGLEELGYQLFSERTRKPFRSDGEFMQACGSMRLSENVWAVPRQANRRRL